MTQQSERTRGRAVNGDLIHASHLRDPSPLRAAAFEAYNIVSHQKLSGGRSGSTPQRRRSHPGRLSVSEDGSRGRLLAAAYEAHLDGSDIEREGGALDVASGRDLHHPSAQVISLAQQAALFVIFFAYSVELNMMLLMSVYMVRDIFQDTATEKEIGFYAGLLSSSYPALAFASSFFW